MKVAIITGASRGIGACVAKGLAADGYSVVLAARSKDGLEQVASQISESNVENPQSVVVYPLDVKDVLAIDTMVSSVVSTFGRIDLLINNAGMGCLGTLSVSTDEFDEVIATNLKGPFALLQSVVPVMKSQGFGTIINIASIAGKVGFANRGAYGATKFGLVGLSESLYREVSPEGIRITTLCPSFVNTDMSKDEELPSDYMVQTDDILKTVRWLLSLSPAVAIKELVIECRMLIA